MTLLQSFTDAAGPQLEFAARLLIDLTCVIALVRGVYYRAYGRSDMFLTFFSFNVVIFLIAFLLNRVEMTLGAAFGLFAVFSMLRYRTEGISTQDMTYLFLVIALGLIMAISQSGPAMLAFTGGAMLACTQLLEGNWIARRELAQQVMYDDISLITVQRRADLIGDLCSRTGLNIHRVNVEEIDLLKDAARLTVYYHPR